MLVPFNFHELTLALYLQEPAHLRYGITIHSRPRDQVHADFVAYETIGDVFMSPSILARIAEFEF